MGEVRQEPANEPDIETELRDAVARILQSGSRRKLVVAGPGTGKTTLFRKLLEESKGDKDSRLVLTFINNLKKDLVDSLGHLATVHTLHGYCQSLLHNHSGLRAGLSEDFLCLPGMTSLIKRDWEYIRNEPAPHFVEMMRSLAAGDKTAFYLERADYYDAVDFDDSVYRTYRALVDAPKAVQGYDLVLIDEYQDFNRMEAAVIDTIAQHNAIVVAGDDDQALYSQLRGASWDHIRSLYHGNDYEVFPLPFCMRCPEVIVGAVNDVIARAREARRLGGRIDKPYRHYEPLKGADSRRYPRIDRVTTTVQRNNANYFGRYIEEAVRRIPQEEIAEAHRKGEPAVLIIGSRQYLRQVVEHLTRSGFAVDSGGDRDNRLERTAGLELLKGSATSNLGWRVILEFQNEELASSCIQRASAQGLRLANVIPEELKANVLKEAREFVADDRQGSSGLQREAGKQFIIKATSFEGAKGLSSQHVFIIGLHAGDLPRDTNNIQDLEVCKFVVGLTRAKKKCSLLLTRSFAGERKDPSPFISWINAERFEIVTVNAAYWAAREQE